MSTQNTYVKTDRKSNIYNFRLKILFILTYGGPINNEHSSMFLLMFFRHILESHIMAELPRPELTFDLVETGCHGNYEAIRTQDRSNERIKLPLKTVITLNAPIATKVVCFSRLLKCLRSLYCKQCRPRSDCSYRSSLFWVHVVCFYTEFVSNVRQFFYSRRHFQMNFFSAL